MMCRTGMSRFGIKNWIFLLVCLQLFTYAQGGEGGGAGDWGVRWSVEPGDAVAAAGERVALPCSAVSRHALRLAWRHDPAPTATATATSMPTRDHTLAHHDKYRKQLANGTLVIESMSPAMAGHYQCVATVDGVGTIVSRVALLFLAEVPEIVPVTRSVLGAAGGAALLPCGIRPAPRTPPRVYPAPLADRRVYVGRLAPAPPLLKLNVTWLKNGSPVGVEWARVSVSPSGALELDPLRAHDAGHYACRVALLSHPHMHRTGEEIELRVSADAGGSVESPPRFIATPQPLTVIEGTSVTFDCAATGNPKPEITWLNNGVAIDLSDLDSRLWLAGYGSLVVQGARALDAGAYTCRAASPIDSADHTTQLHVMTVPRVTVGGGAGAGAGADGERPPEPVVTARERGDVTLRCAVKGRPPPRALWLKDGDPLSPNNHDIVIVDGTSLRIQGVLRVDAGMFQCMAVSEAGVAGAALRLLVLPPDDDMNSTLLRSPTSPNDTLPPVPHDPPTYPDDFLGETSSAYTSGPEVYNDYDYNNNDYFHAAQGLDLEGLKKGGNVTVTPPKGLKAVIVKPRFVTLSWEPPEGKDQVTGYAVIYKVLGSDRERVSRGPASRHEVNVAGLTPNTTYLFAVRAYGNNALSDPTHSITVATSIEETSHGPPLETRAEAGGAHSVRVTWAPPALAAYNDTLPSPHKYTICYTEVETGREQFQVVEVDPSSTTYTHTLTGLRPATTYTVSVAAAAGGAGGGAAGGEVVVRTDSAAPAAPVGNLTATPAGATSITVRWDAPPGRSHGAPLTGYKVRYRPAPAPAPVPGAAPAAPRRKPQSLTTPANTRRAHLTGLDTATAYQVRVAAINAVGVGPFSEWVTSSTTARDLDESGVPDQPPPLTIRAGRDWISVSWSEGGGGGGGATGVVVRGYLLGWGLGVPDETSRSLPHHHTHYVIRHLQPNAEYVISLRASNSRGLGPAVYSSVRTRGGSDEGAGGGDDDGGDELDDDGGEGEGEEDEVEEQVSLIPPVGVKAIMLSGSTAVVYWTDPTLPKGQSVSDGRRYVVRWATVGAGGGTGGGGGGGTPRYFNASDLNCMLDDLKPFTQYEFSVKLIKGGRSSAWSMLVHNTSLEAPPASPPRELRAAPAPPAARAVDLVWDKPAKPNGVITGYVIMYAISRGGGGVGGEEWTAVAAGGERGRARVDRLRPRTTYLFKVQAKNSKGLGPFCQAISYTTAMESGGGGGLATATSAWLWASAGGACAVLALAAALALSLCCRRHQAPPDTSTYQKASASAGIKPPDLWIHHDQMELKHMDKGIHASASKISAGSVEGALVSSSMSVGRGGGEYEPARGGPPMLPPHPHPHPHPHPPPHIDSYHYHPTYVECGGSSVASDEPGGTTGTGSIARATPPSPSLHCPRCQHTDCCTYNNISMTGGIGGGGVGVGGGGGGGVGAGAGCSSTCERRPHRPHHDHITHASTPLLGVGSPQSSLASLHPPPCGGGTCPMGAGCGAPGPAPAPAGTVGPGGDVYACAARERGHYVAYEPLGHYTHRDSVSSEVGGSLHRRAGGGGGGGTLPAGAGAGGMHSFALSDNASDHSTPPLSHSRGSGRDTSPYKKSANSSPGHIPNRLHLGSMVECGTSELEPLTPSRSTERLQREMQNLEGLMKDLSQITHHHFNC